MEQCPACWLKNPGKKSMVFHGFPDYMEYSDGIFSMLAGKPWKIYSRVFQQAWKKYRPNTPCNLENHGKTWIFFQGFPDYMLAGKPWKKIHVFPWFSRLHGVFGRYFFHACWKTLENIPGFSTFNIPWMPGITWKIVQLIPWSLERKKKILVYKTEYMHANPLVHYLKNLPFHSRTRLSL